MRSRRLTATLLLVAVAALLSGCNVEPTVKEKDLFKNEGIGQVYTKVETEDGKVVDRGEYVSDLYKKYLQFLDDNENVTVKEGRLLEDVTLLYYSGAKYETGRAEYDNIKWTDETYVYDEGIDTDKGNTCNNRRRQRKKQSSSI